MRNSILSSLCLAPLCLVGFVTAQNTSFRPAFYDRAIIEQNDGDVLLRANGPRPLDQAVEAIRQGFGWQVDYEDPPYGAHDLVDNTDPVWRSEHPTAKGVTRVAGGMFTTSFNLVKSGAGPLQQEETALGKIVSDYNGTDNPGQFIVKNEGRGRFSIVGVALKAGAGTEKAINPVLDAKIELPEKEYVVADAISIVLRLVSQTTGQTVAPGYWPINMVTQTKLKIGGERQSARELLSQVASSTRLPPLWRLLYDGDSGIYYFSLAIAQKPQV